MEGLIGEVLIAFADVSMQAWHEVQDTGLTAATRSQGGSLVAVLHQAQQALGAVKFANTVHQQAQLRLRQHRGITLSTATVGAIADEVLGIVTQVDAVMRAGAH